MEELFSYSKSIPYEADEFYVFRHPRERRKYAVHIDGGCSCYEGIQVSLAELEGYTPMGKREVYAEFSKWWNDDDCMGTKIDVLQSLRDAL